MAIDQRFLDELNARCDIVDLVSRYVKLKRSGSNYFGLCPFHNEKTASFSVAPDKQIFHCFGCGAGGGPIRFIMKIEGLEFRDAVEFLARQYGMEVPEDTADHGQRQRRERLLQLMKDAARWFYAQLHAPQGAVPLHYFQQRALSKKTMNNFGLGYAPDSFHALLDAMTAKGYTKEELFAAGLIARSQKGTYYDKFRNRVMFPIIDIRGDVIAFGGRVMDDSKPKYLNSPETTIFNKSRNLFAINVAKKTKSEQFLLAEGYMDVIALHQAGFDSAVASLGTSLTEEQARLMSHYTKNVVICYDADGAGQKAAQRAIDILGRAGLSVRVLRIPGAKDPDEFIREHGAEAFRKLIERSENHIMYRLQTIQDKYDLTQDDQRILFLRDAAREVASLTNAVEREVYTARAAKTAGVSAQSFALEVKREQSRRRRQENKRYHREVQTPAAAAQPRDRSIRYENVRSALAEEGLLRLMFQDGALIPEIRAAIAPSEFSSQLLGMIFQKACTLYEEGHHITTTHLEAELTEGQMDHLGNVLAQPIPIETRQQAIQDYVAVVHNEYLKRTMQAQEDDDSLLRIAERKKKEAK